MISVDHRGDHRERGFFKFLEKMEMILVEKQKLLSKRMVYIPQVGLAN